MTGPEFESLISTLFPRPKDAETFLGIGPDARRDLCRRDEIPRRYELALAAAALGVAGFAGFPVDPMSERPTSVGARVRVAVSDAVAHCATRGRRLGNVLTLDVGVARNAFAAAILDPGEFAAPRSAEDAAEGEPDLFHREGRA